MISCFRQSPLKEDIPESSSKGSVDELFNFVVAEAGR
jgi:hypothetical protein